MNKQQTKQASYLSNNQTKVVRSQTVSTQAENFDKVEYTQNRSMFSVIKKKKVHVQSYETVLFFSTIKPQPVSIRKITKQNHHFKPTYQNYTTTTQTPFQQTSLSNHQESTNLSLFETAHFKIVLPSIKELLSNQTLDSTASF